MKKQNTTTTAAAAAVKAAPAKPVYNPSAERAAQIAAWAEDSRATAAETYFWKKAACEAALAARSAAAERAEAAAEGSAERRALRTAAAEADSRAGRALMEMAAAVCNSVLKRAFDPTARRAGALAEAAAEAAEKEAAEGKADSPAEAAAWAEYAEKQSSDSAYNSGAAAKIAALRAAAPADVEALNLIYSDSEAAEAEKDSVLSDAADIIQTAAAALLSALAEAAAEAAEGGAVNLESEYRTAAEAEADKKPACAISRANRAAERAVNSRRGLRLKDSKTIYFEDFTRAADDGGQDENGLDVLYRKAGRFAALAGCEGGSYSISQGTIERAEAFIALFALTPTEARRILRAAGGMSRKQIAEAEGTTKRAVQKSIEAARAKIISRAARAAAEAAECAEQQQTDSAERRAAVCSAFAAHVQRLSDSAEAADSAAAVWAAVEAAEAAEAAAALAEAAPSAAALRRRRR